MKLFKLISGLMLCSLAVNQSYAQIRPDVNLIFDELGRNVRTYFLSANRPGFDVNAYTTPKNKVEINLSFIGNNEIFDVPISISYGAFEKLEVFSGISLYTQSYRFSGKKVDGIGDANLGIKYKFHQSEFFDHAFQSVVKIPTASSTNELGTGLVDFHLGLAQAFYVKPWNYDLSFELNFLRRRKAPSSTREIPPELREGIDSIKSVYNYKYEPEFVASFFPAYEISSKLDLYVGISYSRNFKLDFSTSSFYTGIGYSLSKNIAVGLGTSFGLLNSTKWLISLGLSSIL